MTALEAILGLIATLVAMALLGAGFYCSYVQMKARQAIMKMIVESMFKDAPK